MDFSKYKYQKEKEERASRKNIKEIGIRGIRARLTISQHDMGLKAKKAEEFLQNGDRVRFELILRGREKGLRKEFINERLQLMLAAITIPYEIADGPKRGPRGLVVTISPQHHAKNKQGGGKTNQSDTERENSKTTSSPKPL